MSVFVSQHAITRFQERCFTYSMNSDEIECFLKDIVLRGHSTRRRAQNNCYPVYEFENEGQVVVAEVQPGLVSIITYLGDAAYRYWWHRKKPTRNRQRRRKRPGGLQQNLQPC